MKCWLRLKNTFLSYNAQIVVTGKGSDILEGLEQIQFQEKPLKVRYFDKWGRQLTAPITPKQPPKE